MCSDSESETGTEMWCGKYVGCLVKEVSDDDYLCWTVGSFRSLQQWVLSQKEILVGFLDGRSCQKVAGSVVTFRLPRVSCWRPFSRPVRVPPRKSHSQAENLSLYIRFQPGFLPWTTSDMCLSSTSPQCVCRWRRGQGVMQQDVLRETYILLLSNLYVRYATNVYMAYSDQL